MKTARVPGSNGPLRLFPVHGRRRRLCGFSGAGGNADPVALRAGILPLSQLDLGANRRPGFGFSSKFNAMVWRKAGPKFVHLHYRHAGRCGLRRDIRSPHPVSPRTPEARSFITCAPISRAPARTRPGARQVLRRITSCSWITSMRGCTTSASRRIPMRLNTPIMIAWSFAFRGRSSNTSIRTGVRNLRP